MKHIFMYFLCLLFTGIYTVNGQMLKVNTGIKIPLAYGFNTPDGFKSWKGLQYGAGIFADIKIPSLADILSTELNLTYSRDKFNLNEDEFTKGSFIEFNNLRTSIIEKYWFSPGIFAGAGLEFITQLSGTWGNDEFDNDLKDDELGTDTYLAMAAGYSMDLTEKINIIGEIKGAYDLTIEATRQWDAGIRIGAGYNFEL